MLGGRQITVERKKKIKKYRDLWDKLFQFIPAVECEVDGVVYGRSGIRTEWYTEWYTDGVVYGVVYGRSGIRTEWYTDGVVYGRSGIRTEWYTDKM